MINTPLWDFYLTNNNFYEIEDFENHNLVVKRVDEHIEVYFKLTYSPNLWIYTKNGYYYVSVNHANIIGVLTNDQSDVSHITEFFSKLYLYKDHYEVHYLKESEINIYKVNRNSHGNYVFANIICDWVKRYDKLINSIPIDKMCIELSGGYDTRILTYFWRYSNKVFNVYTKKYSYDAYTAQNVINAIQELFPCRIKLVEKTDAKQFDYTLSGVSQLHRYFEPTTIQEFKTEIGNSTYSNFAMHIVKDICPFYDKEFLKLDGKFPGETKMLLIYLLCDDKDFYKVPGMSFKKEIIFDNNVRKVLEIDYLQERLELPNKYFTELKYK